MIKTQFAKFSVSESIANTRKEVACAYIMIILVIRNTVKEKGNVGVIQ